MLVFKKKKS